ncbi:unnamed protein product [Closterium sp. Naga37s-1]|nr:unnamed protein product [Closterium sp. Naga37s-1]
MLLDALSLPCTFPFTPSARSSMAVLPGAAIVAVAHLSLPKAAAPFVSRQRTQQYQLDFSQRGRLTRHHLRKSRPLILTAPPAPMADSPPADRHTTLDVSASAAAAPGGGGIANDRSVLGQRLLALGRGRLRLFLDTADVAEWEKWLPTGIFHGVTTNPLLLERAGRECSVDALAELAHTAFGLGAQEIQLQTWGATADEMVETGKRLGIIDPRVVIKIPATVTGIQAARQLISTWGFRVTLTAVYASHQVLLAQGVGAQYAAPYLGRMDALGKDGKAEIIAMQQAVSAAGSATRVLVASVREPEEVSLLAAAGVDTFALPPAIVARMLLVQETETAAADFERAALAQAPKGN